MHRLLTSAIIIGMFRFSGPPRRRAERSGLRLASRRLVLAVVAVAAVCLAAGCGSAIKNAGSAIKSAASSLVPHSDSASPDPSDTITPTPTDTITPTPTVTPTSTVTVTPTVTPSTQITTRLVTPHPKTSTTPASASSTKYVWLWVLLGVVLLVGLIAWIAAAAHRRRSAAASAWRSKAVDAYARGSALYDAMSVAEAPGGLTAPDAGARWYDIQRRADDLAQQLYGLRETARNEDDRADVTDVIASLQGVRSAMDAERAPGAGPEQAGIARSRLHAFGESLRALQTPERIR
jgi:hypothetical protein